MNDATSAAAAKVTKEPKPRLYAVANKVDGSVRLVMATNIPAASRHVAQDILDVTLPSAIQAMDIQKANPNIEIEQA